MIVLYLIAAIAVAFVIVVALQPADFTIMRSARIAAPPEKVFPHVNNLRAWDAWSPWAKLDPDAKSTFTGPESGVGAAMAWAGNNQVGEGRMTITDSKPSALVRFKLEFVKPMKATNLAEFTFKPEGSGTVVSWTMSGKNNFVGKAFSLILNCEKMVGGQFDKGLATLKSVAETAAKP